MSIAKKNPAARVPQRKRGEERVAALLKAAATVFVEKGYAATTMTEIAQRAKAPIGSLYQFFPNKEVLGKALMQRFLELAVAALTKIEHQATLLSAPKLAKALLDVFINLQAERDASISLLDSQPEMDRSRPTHFRVQMLLHLQLILKIRAPNLAATKAEAMAQTVLQQMKTAAALGGHMDARSATTTLGEMRAMLALYLAAKLE